MESAAGGGVSDAAAVLPAPGDVFADGLSPGFTWLVSEVDDDTGLIGLNLRSPDGEVTGSFLRWPSNRWAALVAKQLLTPVGGEG
jgi:hypothetical protein